MFLLEKADKSLEQYAEKIGGFNSLSQELKVKILLQIAKGVRTLHTLGIAH